MHFLRITLAALLLVSVGGCDLNDLDPVSDGAAGNGAPTINELTSEPMIIEAGSFALFSVLATDPESEILTFEWSTEAGTLSGNGPSATWEAPSVEGAFSIDVLVTDPAGNSDEGQFFVPVIAPKVLEPGNSHPVIDSFTSADDTLMAGSTTTITVVATDPEGDALAYEWLMGIGTGDADGPETDWTPNGDACCTETYVVGVKVRDGRGGIATASLGIFVIVE